jgi:rod shape-determining protein MreD
MNAFLWLLLNLVLYTVQNHWFMFFSTMQSPDLLLLLLLLFALDKGGKKAAGYGLGLGAFLDIVTFSYFGFHMVTRASIGALIGSNRMNVFADRMPTFMVLSALTTLLLNVARDLFLCIVLRRWLPFFPLAVLTLKCMFWNLLCAPFMWLLYHWLKRRFDSRRAYYYHL